MPRLIRVAIASMCIAFSAAPALAQAGTGPRIGLTQPVLERFDGGRRIANVPDVSSRGGQAVGEGALFGFLAGFVLGYGAARGHRLEGGVMLGLAGAVIGLIVAR